MNKILILSDSHGLTSELNEIKQRHQLQYMIHCGDSELEVDSPEMNNFIKVAGNCDFDSRYPDEQMLDINGLKLLIVHGHLHGVKGDLTTLSYRATELGAQVACYGHTHIADARDVEEILFVNPGSIRLPKVRVEKTYCIMEWGEVSRIDVNFYTLNGSRVDELSYSTTIN